MKNSYAPLMTSWPMGATAIPFASITATVQSIHERNREDLKRPSIADIETATSRRSDYSSIFAIGEAAAVMSRFLHWFFRNCETGDITIAQAPNLILWVVIAAGGLRWLWHPPGTAAVALDIVFKGGLIMWSLDEIFRGVNPWRRCLGGAVLAYEFATLL